MGKSGTLSPTAGCHAPRPCRLLCLAVTFISQHLDPHCFQHNMILTVVMLSKYSEIYAFAICELVCKGLIHLMRVGSGLALVVLSPISPNLKDRSRRIHLSSRSKDRVHCQAASETAADSFIAAPTKPSVSAVQSNQPQPQFQTQ